MFTEHNALVVVVVILTVNLNGVGLVHQVTVLKAHDVVVIEVVVVNVFVPTLDILAVVFVDVALASVAGIRIAVVDVTSSTAH